MGNYNRCYFGDARKILPELIEKKVFARTCVTSPPYFGLRDYGVENQIGLESSIEEYVGALVSVFSLVKDILSDDGTLWLNLGDSYGGSGGIGNQYDSWDKGQPKSFVNPNRKLASKQLLGIPWRVAFALQDSGWILRSEIIWHKPNPTPESVQDRPTRCHETIFLFSKHEHYYYDQKAIREKGVFPAGSKGGSGSKDRQKVAGVNALAPGAKIYSGTRNKRTVWTVRTKPFPDTHFAVFPEELITPCILAGSYPGDLVLDPFLGSGTTAVVSQRYGRRWLGVELNHEYKPIIDRRISQVSLFCPKRVKAINPPQQENLL